MLAKRRRHRLRADRLFSSPETLVGAGFASWRVAGVAASGQVAIDATPSARNVAQEARSLLTRWGRVHMVFAFDTLSYSRFLRERVVSQEHAEAARQFIMAELVTKQDLPAVRQDLQDVVAVFDANWENLSRYLDAKLDNFSLRITVRFGVMLAAGIGAFAALIKLT